MAPLTPVAISADQLTIEVGVTIGPLDFSLPRGAVLGLVGANGSGKTSLLKCICGLVRPGGGSVDVGGARVQHGRMPAGVSALIEEPRFFERVSARVNLRIAAGSDTRMLGRIDDLLNEVGLQAADDRRVAHFSQGMRQRLGIARALLRDPDLLLLDEPNNGLDPHGVYWLRTLIAQRSAQGLTTVVSSHVLHEVQEVCSHICILFQGRLLAYGDAATLLRNSNGRLEDLYFRLLSPLDHR